MVLKCWFLRAGLQIETMVWTSPLERVEHPEE
jgi:hypothetical protein